MSYDEREMAATFYREERAKIEKREAARAKERSFLKDKRIGGPGPAPRPSDAYIDQSLGKPMSREAMTEEASRKATARLKAFKEAERKKEEAYLKQDFSKKQGPSVKPAFQESAKRFAKPEQPQKKMGLARRILQRQRTQAKDITRKP